MLYTSKMSVKRNFLYVKEVITIEPIICFYLIAINMRAPTINNLLLEVACSVNEGFNNTVCDAIITGKHEQRNFTAQNSAVQEHISEMLSWCLPIQSTIPVILLLFLGTYSDRHGIRKPFLLIPIFGEFFSNLTCMICIMFKEKWPVEAAGIAHYIIPAFYGGLPMIYMAAFAYIADVSSPEMRIVRMAILQLCVNICNPIGIAFSGLLFDVIGYIPSLLLGLLMVMIALLYGIFIVKEPKEHKEDMKTKDLIVDIINPKHAKKTLMLLTNSSGAQLTNIIYILFMNFIIVTVSSGESSVLFWFTQQTYEWKNTDFAYFSATRSIVNSIALAVAVPLFSKVFHLHDLVIIAISFLDKILANIVCLTVRTPCGLYIGNVVGLLTSLGTSGIRSQSTKCVSTDDMGKTQSLLSIIEAIATSIAVQVYNQGIYSYTRETYSQAFFFVGIVLCTLALIIMMLQYFIKKSQSSEKEVANGITEKA